MRIKKYRKCIIITEFYFCNKFKIDYNKFKPEIIKKYFGKIKLWRKLSNDSLFLKVDWCVNAMAVILLYMTNNINSPNDDKILGKYGELKTIQG